jgi:ferredoxin, 2Fe-2S
MPYVTYLCPDGTEKTLDARVGDSVMETAVRNGVRGIVAECGGACACATCHVFVDEEYAVIVGGPGPLEDDMLDGAVTPRTERSRLSCQIKMRDEFDGLVVRIAPEQE